jgi:hypothetical protein
MENNRIGSELFNEAKFHPDPEGVTGTQSFPELVGAMDLANKLIVMNPGEDLFDPNMGVGINNFKFERINTLIDSLQARLTEQVEMYIGSSMQLDVAVNQERAKTLEITVTIPAYTQKGIMLYQQDSNGTYTLQSLFQ